MSLHSDIFNDSSNDLKIIKSPVERASVTVCSSLSLPRPKLQAFLQLLDFRIWNTLQRVCPVSIASRAIASDSIVSRGSSEQTSPSCAGVLPQEHNHLFCSQTLWLYSWIAFGSDCLMTFRGSNLDTNLNSATCPTSWKGFIRSEILECVCRLNYFQVSWRCRNGDCDKRWALPQTAR